MSHLEYCKRCPEFSPSYWTILRDPKMDVSCEAHSHNFCKLAGRIGLVLRCDTDPTDESFHPPNDCPFELELLLERDASEL